MISLPEFRRYHIAFCCLRRLFDQNPYLFRYDKKQESEASCLIYDPRPTQKNLEVVGNRTWDLLCYAIIYAQLPPPGSSREWEPQQIGAMLLAHENGFCTFDETIVFYRELEIAVSDHRQRLFQLTGC